MANFDKREHDIFNLLGDLQVSCCFLVGALNNEGALILCLCLLAVKDYKNSLNISNCLGF